MCGAMDLQGEPSRGWEMEGLTHSRDVGEGQQPGVHMQVGLPGPWKWMSPQGNPGTVRKRRQHPEGQVRTRAGDGDCGRRKQEAGRTLESPTGGTEVV